MDKYASEGRERHERIANLGMVEEGSVAEGKPIPHLCDEEIPLKRITVRLWAL